MKPRNEVKLDEAVAAVREEEVDLRAAESARGRVWERLSGDARAIQTIRGCADVRALLRPYAEGALPAARALLVEDHLHECAACRAVVKGNEAAVAPWRASLRVSPGRAWTWRQVAAAVAVAGFGLAGYASRDFLLGIPPGPRAEVQSIAGSLYRVADHEQTPLRPGDVLGEGEVVRAGRGAQAALRLRDGSTVEIGEHAELSVTARRRDTTVHLERGSLIVAAEKRRTGHLYVASADCTVAVTGTVFSVNRGIKGSRVAVAEGEVRVRRSAEEHVLRSGQQFSTSASLHDVPIRGEFSWSRNARVIGELAKLRRDLESVITSGVRHESRLLRAVPANAAVYVGAPNYGESLAQAHAVLEERVQQSDVLRQWWQRHGPGRRGGPALADMVSKLRALGGNLGDEVVMAFVPKAGSRRDDHHVLFLAEPRSGGLRAFLESEMFAGLPKPPRLQFVTNTAAMPAGAADLYVLVRSDLVAASSDRATLRAAVSAFEGKAPGLDDVPFGRRIAEAYRDGTGLVVAADVSEISGARRPPEALGIGDFQYFVAERTEVDGHAQNSAELSFAGTRRGIASWLGAPAPMGSLSFVSPEAAAVASFVTKNPALVFDDILSFHRDRNEALRELAKVESQLQLRVREDFAAALGSDFTVALDGPMLPTPAFKLVAEVYDPQRLEQAFEAMVEAVHREAERHDAPVVDLEHEQAGGRTFHRLRVSADGKAPFEIHYTFTGGYLVAAPSRALVMKAIAVSESGRSLARSTRLTEMWPADGQMHVSALLYQNLASAAQTAQEAAANMSPQDRQAFEELLAQVRPSLVYARGGEDRIQIAGDLFNFDPTTLALPAFLKDAVTGRRSAR